jgi:hypothetical protein
MQALRPKLWASLVLVLGGAGAFAATQGAQVEAADHNDPPARVHSGTASADDRASDIADVFAWVRGSGASQTTVIAMSFDGPNPATPVFPLPCDPDVLYQIHITSDGGICPAMNPDGGACGTADATHPCGPMCTASFDDMHTINVRFAQNGTGGGCVVQAEFASATGATPISATIAGALEYDLTAGTAGMTHMWAGLRDDAFSFDLAGFQQTASTGMLHFTPGNPPDSFAGMNTPVIVFEMPTSAISRAPRALPATGTVIRVWGSTARYSAAHT